MAQGACQGITNLAGGVKGDVAKDLIEKLLKKIPTGEAFGTVRAASLADESGETISGNQRKTQAE
jgi:hypothetical protein